jgi:hypothetical protein
MALLDPGTGALVGAVVFLLVLGVLVIFVEALRTSLVLTFVIVAVVGAALLASLGELGLGFALLGFGGAVIADHAFDWLTTR